MKIYGDAALWIFFMGCSGPGNQCHTHIWTVTENVSIDRKPTRKIIYRPLKPFLQTSPFSRTACLLLDIWKMGIFFSRLNLYITDFQNFIIHSVVGLREPVSQLYWSFSQTLFVWELRVPWHTRYLSEEGAFLSVNAGRGAVTGITGENGVAAD